MTPKEAYHFKKYMKKTAFTIFGRIYIDPAVWTPVNLDCSNCSHVHKISCCEDGQPYSMSGEAEHRLASHAEPIVRRHLPEKLQDLRENGFLESTHETGFTPTIKKCSGNCFFYAGSAEAAYCSIHRYALEEELDPAQLKPFSCTLFPLDIIQDIDLLVITALTRDTMAFSRWGTEYQDYLCINQEARLHAEVKADWFAQEGYQPAWSWNRHLLQQTFGQELIRAIEESMPGHGELKRSDP